VNHDQPVQCVLYARFSPRPNADECLSCERQIADLRALAESKGWTVRSVHQDANTSGRDQHRIVHQRMTDPEGVNWVTLTMRVKERAGLSEALQALKRGDYLLVTQYDRLARDTQLAAAYLEIIEARGCKLVTAEGGGEVVEDPDQELLRDIKWAIAKNERSKKGNLTQKRMLANQAAGRRMSKIAPFGFADAGDEIVRTPTGKTTLIHRLEPVARERKIIQAIVKLRGEGVGPRAIARRLNESGIDCRGGPWYHGTVRSIIRREGLVGANGQ